jgi:AraC-like DNA-binding protein
MMKGTPMDWVHGPWTVQLQSINRSSYERLSIKNRIFPHWIISYIKEGEVTTETGGEYHHVRSGEVMLHPPHLPFSEHAERNGTHLWMHASIVCSQNLDLLQLYRIYPVVSIADPIRYEASFQKLYFLWDNREVSFRELKLTSCMLQLMEQILTDWEKAGRPDRPEAYHSTRDRYARLIGQMSIRLQEKLSRDELAALVRLNANYLDRSFQRQFGLTPMQMLRDMRLQRSKQLLERTDDTLESIATQCGMSDASYLCKQFKKRYGLLPGEYRESVRSSQSEDLYIQ